MTSYRLAKLSELDELKTFLFHHGANPWNHLPLEAVNSEFALIAAGQASAVVAYRDQQPLGLGILPSSGATKKLYDLQSG